jgi:hypothetical protein
VAFAAVVVGAAVVELAAGEVVGDDEVEVAVEPDVGSDDPSVTFAGLDWNDSTPTRPTPVPVMT